MPYHPKPIDPCDVAGINAQTRAWAADDETVCPVDINQIVIAEDAIHALAEITRSLARNGRVLLVVDRTPMSRGRDSLKPLVEDALGRACQLTVRRLPDQPGAEFHAYLEYAQRLADELADYAAVVSVGSGSITDVAKYARHLAADKRSAPLPFICFPTAASVTAYTSALSVLTIDGVKNTLPSRPPEAIVCDLRTLAAAPRPMTLAGFGDVLARSVAYGDWYLAHQLGMSESFSHVAGKLLEPAEQVMIDAAEQVAVSDIPGVRTVLDGVLLAGMAMSIVNMTAPISGWEHVISHFIDMTAGGRGLALHGAQVGVATLVVARAYDRAWSQIDLDRITAETLDAETADHRKTIEKVFGPYDPSGKMVAEIWRQYETKMKAWQAARDARRVFVERKRSGEIDAFLARAVRGSDEIDHILRRAAGPRRFAELTPPVPAGAAHAALCHSHFVRARFTLGDLLARAGWLTPQSAAALLDEPAEGNAACC